MTCLVAGGGSGIGRAAAMLLARRMPVVVADNYHQPLFNGAFEMQGNFSLVGRNVTNKIYLTQVLINAPGGYGAVYGEPANIMGTISFKY